MISAQECNINGICINSNLLDLTNATSGRECLQDCKSLLGCEWYSFKQGTTTSCELLSNCNELSDEDCTACESGQVNCDLIQGFSKFLVFSMISRCKKLFYISSQDVGHCKPVQHKIFCCRC